MNISSRALEEQELEERAVPNRRPEKVPPKQSRPTKFGRNYGKGPQQFNGMHRRRRRKMRW